MSTIEAPISISLAGLLPAVVRIVWRIMPKPLRKCSAFGYLGLWANAKALRHHFDNTEDKLDKHVHRVAIEGAYSILGRLDIPHLEKKVSPAIWRAFLAEIVVAAQEADIKRARAVMSNAEWGYVWARPSDFREASESQASTEPPAEPEFSDVVPDAEAVRRDPGHGYRVARLIMKCRTVDEVQTLYEDFKNASNKTSESKALAAYAFKKERLLNGDQDEDWWWDFYEEAAKLEDSDEVIREFERLEKEFPIDKDQAGDG